MKPEQILQSDWVDILFENRNKAYGAYFLRRHYQKYLWKAIFIMLAVIAIFIFLAGIQKPKNIFQILNVSNPVSVQPIPIIPENPPAPAPQKAIVRQNLATEKFSTIKIMPLKDPADQPLPDISEIMDKKIASIAEPGNLDDISVPEENTIAVEAGKAVATASMTPVIPYNNNAVDEAAEYPGGQKAMLRFLQRNIHNPQNEMAVPVQVRIQFIIDETGKAGNFKIIQSGGEVFDREALSTLKKMPRWKPAVKKGRQVAVYYVQPITFETLYE